MWDEEKQEWFFSIVDVCAVLTDQDDYDLAKNYWKVLKHRLIKEGNESVTKCNQLKLTSPKDGKRYSTDVADMGLMFRIIESIPSKKAEPFKQWMTTREYKKHKGLTKENLRDNMTNTKLLSNYSGTLAIGSNL